MDAGRREEEGHKVKPRSSGLRIGDGFGVREGGTEDRYGYRVHPY